MSGLPNPPERGPRCERCGAPAAQYVTLCLACLPPALRQLRHPDGTVNRASFAALRG